MTKEAIKEIWMQVLGTEELADDATFFEVGGNSITILIIMDEIKKACGVELDVNEMDQFDSVDHMYQYLQANH